MSAAIEVAGDVAAAAGALAGLILVYLGAVAASFATYEPTERRSVLGRHQRQAWLAFAGIALCLLAAGLSLFGKWLNVPCMAVGALFILAVALFWVLGTAFLTVRDIK